MEEYRINNEKFKSASTAIDYVFKICTEQNVNAIEIKKVKIVKPHGFMNAIDHEVIDTMVIKGPANYKIDALNSHF